MHIKNRLRAKYMKQKLSKKDQSNFKRRTSVAVLVAVIVLVGGISFQPVMANLQEQINELSQENAEKREESGELQEEATSLQDKISKLQNKINALQKEIADNQNKISQLEVQIKKAEAELEEQRDLLGTNIRAMYVEGDISTLEMLASSKDLSEFVDKQQYRTSVQNKIKDTLDRITELKQQLDAQREMLEKRVEDHRRNQQEIAGEKAEQDELLGLNQSERSKLDAQIRGNNKRIEELKRQQAIENARLFGGTGGVIGGGGYPWGGARCIHTGKVDGWCPNYDWGVGGSIWNPNTGGYGYRNCTDWVSYRVRSQGRYVPAGLGNAKDWPGNARARGYTVSRTPKAGAAAVSTAGYYGHVMYVESVNGGGSITVSDYNRAGTGKYDSNAISSAGLWFIYF